MLNLIESAAQAMHFSRPEQARLKALDKAPIRP
jgi:hypothetical protein